MVRMNRERRESGARRALRQTALLGSLCVALGATFGGCASILGIEDRTLGGAGGEGGDAGGGDSEECVEYCQTVMENCTGGLRQYASEATCLASCATFEPGDPNEPGGNTLACRHDQAIQAGVGNNAGEFCATAGPAGGGECGSDCDAYCTLLEAACPAEFRAIEDCGAMCPGLVDSGAFNTPEHLTGNTVECRIYHTGAALIDPDLHCGHAGFVPTSECLDTRGTEIDCSVYCQNAMAACTGDLAIYESRAQCEATCADFSEFAAGTPPELENQGSPNTLACRQYHSGAAVGDPGHHCPHVSPSGGGVCGGADSPCDSYCLLLGRTCPEQFANVIAAGSGTTDQERCMDACNAALPAASTAAGADYAIPAIQPDTVQCYTLAVARALENPADAPLHCANADVTAQCDPAVGAP